MEEWREPGGNEKDSKNAKKYIYFKEPDKDKVFQLKICGHLKTTHIRSLALLYSPIFKGFT